MQIIPLEFVADLDGPDAELHRGLLAVSNAAVMHDLGNDDYLIHPHDIVGTLTPLPSRTNAMAVAVQDGQVVGYVDTWAPLLDNLNQCGIDVTVHPDHRRQGIGTALLDWAQAWAANLGRTTYTGWMMAPCLAPGAPAVIAPTGDAFPADYPGWQFAVHHGFALEQVERGSTLRLPVANLAQLRDEAAAQSAGYRLLTWLDDLPTPWHDDFAALRSRVTIDAPYAGIETEQEVWDAERLVKQWELSRSLGNHRLTLVAQHEASGQLVAFTELFWHPSNPKLAWQGYTFVRADHRGHKLGLLLKASALEALPAANPTIDHIATDNAGENSWMLAINHALGYELSTLAAALQKKV